MKELIKVVYLYVYESIKITTASSGNDANIIGVGSLVFKDLK